MNDQTKSLELTKDYVRDGEKGRLSFQLRNPLVRCLDTGSPHNDYFGIVSLDFFNACPIERC